MTEDIKSGTVIYEGGDDPARRIVVLDGLTANPGDLDWETLASLGHLVVYSRTPRELAAERMKGAEMVLTNKTIINADTIAASKDLKYIGVLATGYNIVDTDAAAAHGVVVTNIPAYSTMSVAQTAIALLLEITNRVGHYAAENARGRWAQSPDFSYADFPIIELDGKLMGIVGCGNTGHALGRIARTLGMRLAFYSSRPIEELPAGAVKMELDELFSKCDVVSLNCPLTPQTENMVDSRRLNLMKRSAILINTGRGPLVDEAALADALNSGRIYAAGLDVLRQEPPAADNPLLGAHNCFITPHIAWASGAARERLLDMAADNLMAYIARRPRNVVNGTK